MKEIGRVEIKSFQSHVAVVPEINCGNLGPIGGIEQREQRNLLSLRAQLLGNFIGDGAAEAVTAEEVRPVGLHAADLFYVKSGHLFNFGQRRRVSVQILGL